MYQDDEVISIVELEKFLREYQDRIICVGCGKPIGQYWHLEMYPHDGGIRVKEKNNDKYWVYIHHYTCGYDMALWKMEQRLLYLSRDNPKYKGLFKEYIERVYVG